MLLAAALMLDWLGGRHALAALSDAAARLESALASGYQSGAIQPLEQGGSQGTGAVAQAVIGQL